MILGCFSCLNLIFTYCFTAGKYLVVVDEALIQELDVAMNMLELYDFFMQSKLRD